MIIIKKKGEIYIKPKDIKENYFNYYYSLTKGKLNL